MAACHLLLLLCIIVFSGDWINPSVYGATDAANLHQHVVEMKSFVPALSTCSSPTTGHTLKGMKITHRYGPCSPLRERNLHLNSHQILLQDQSRVRYINSKPSSRRSTDELGEGARLPVLGRSVGAGNYVVTVGFGTPRQDFELILDTGSGITWMQCEPCPEGCYRQEGPLFNPSNSLTFSNASCATSKCDYSVNYHDKSYSSGYFGRDTLTISPSEVFPDFVFGCGQNTSQDFGHAAGLLAIGQDGPYSLVSQTAVNFAKIFCYCLPSTESSTGYLLFGMEALETCQIENSTPLLSDRTKPSLYFVNLIAITIGHNRVGVSSDMSSSPGTIMDSGTVITRLPPSVYHAIRSAFQASMSHYPPAPPLPPLLDTCYNLEGYTNVTIPSMVLHFEELNVYLDPSAVIWKGRDDSQVCLAFAGNEDASDLAIIGNHQQRSLNILYDIQERKVEIGVGGCSKR